MRGYFGILNVLAADLEFQLKLVLIEEHHYHARLTRSTIPLIRRGRASIGHMGRGK